MEYFCASYNIDLKESKLEIFIQLCKASKNVKKWNMITYTTVRIVYLKEWFLIDIYVKRCFFTISSLTSLLMLYETKPFYF